MQGTSFQNSDASTSESHQSTATGAARPAKKPLWLIGAISLIVAAVFWCYFPAVVNGFHGDDFLHVNWLTQAANKPSMVWDNFIGPWLGATDVKFYRPLISVIFWCEYQLWGFNAIGYHLTNIAFHLAGAICLLFIGRRLALLSGFDERAARTTGVLAAVLWGIYPLNAEVVAWITGRVDATVTAFSLGCLLTYLQWRESHKPVTLVSSLLLFVLALLCKEMAVIVPPLLVCIDVLYRKEGQKGILRSLPFWLVLGGYMIVRQLTMGTMIGSYDNTLTADWKVLWKRYKDGLPFLFRPFNLNVFQRSDLIVRLWQYLFTAVLAFGFLQLLVTKAKTWRLHALCLIWFGLALVPVYKVFSVAQDLESSRYAYSAVLPLCLWLSVLATPVVKNRLLARAQIATFLALAGVGAFALQTHCTIWRQAAQISNRIVQQVYDLVKELPAGQPAVLLMGAPDNFNGAYIMRNALPGMVTPPYFPKAIGTVRNLDRFCALYPFALFRDSRTVRTDAVVACWDDKASCLRPARLSPSSWSDKRLALPLKNIQVGGATGHLTDQGLKVSARQKYVILDLRDLKAECPAIDFIQVTVKDCGDDLEPSTMTYVNDHHPNAWPTWSSTVRPSVVKIAPNMVRLIFPLRQHPEWVLSKYCSELVFGLPAADFTVTAIEATSAAHLIPRVTLPASASDGSSLSLGAEPQELSVRDRDNKTLVLEVSPPGQYFEKQYATAVRPQSILRYFKPDRPILLEQNMFAPGAYQARVWWSGSNGQPEGLSSDHFTMFVPQRETN